MSLPTTGPGVWTLICCFVLESGERSKVLHGRTIVKMGLTRKLPLEGEESRLSLPVPVPTVSLTHPHPVPGTRRFISCKVQPGNTAETRSTGHPFLIFPSPFFLPSLSLAPFPSPPALQSLKYLWSTYSVPGAGDTMSKTDAVSALLSVGSLKHRQRE